MARIRTSNELFGLLRQTDYRMRYALGCWTELAAGTTGTLKPPPGNGCQITVRQHGTDMPLCVPRLHMLFGDRSVQMFEVSAPSGTANKTRGKHLAVPTGVRPSNQPRQTGRVTIINQVENGTAAPEMLASLVNPQPQIHLLYMMLTLERVDPGAELPADYRVDLEVRGAPYGITEENRSWGASARASVPQNAGEYTALGVLLSPDQNCNWCAVCVPPFRRVEITTPKPAADEGEGAPVTEAETPGTPAAAS